MCIGRFECGCVYWEGLSVDVCVEGLSVDVCMCSVPKASALKYLFWVSNLYTVVLVFYLFCYFG